MRHEDLARRISELIHEERYEEAGLLLPDYVGAVTSECLEQESFLTARSFLRSACDATRAV
jgi:hypothetical protein